MIAVIATVNVKAGQESDFEAEFKALREQVKAHEPGTLVYELCRSRGDKPQYKIVEHYQDTDAWMAHKEAAYTRQTVPKLHALFDGASADILDSIDL
tara:strand:- start:6255 stop:6545 length:291 start_codon:yes stop_codon:yes gene_type:complete